MTPLSILRGVAFVYLVYGSIFFGTLFVILPFTPLIMFGTTRPLYRRCIDRVAQSWFSFVAFLIEKLGGVETIVSSDKETLKALDRPCLILLNHRTEVDWMFIWVLIAHLGTPATFKIVLKSPLKFLPGGGWATQLLLLLFLDRRWESDRNHISRWLSHVTESKYPMQLLLFPEGTDWAPKKLISSNAYADKMGLAHTVHVLQPRVTGFNHIVGQLRGSGYSLVDMTVAYPPDYLRQVRGQAGLNLITGVFPKHINFHIQATKLDSLPTSDKELSDRCVSIWTEKDTRLADAYAKGGHFPGPSMRINHRSLPAIASCVWIPFTVGLTYFLCYSRAVQMVFGCGSVICVLVSVVFGGFDKLFARQPTPNELQQQQQRKSSGGGGGGVKSR